MDTNLVRALASLTTGIYVLTVSDGEHHHGMPSWWATQVSGSPPLFSTAVDNNHFSRGMVERTGKFALNVVGSRGKVLEDYFYSARAKRADNLEGLEYELSPKLGLPWLKLALVSFDARGAHAFVAGDHTIFFGEPAGARIGSPDWPLLSIELFSVYFGG